MAPPPPPPPPQPPPPDPAVLMDELVEDILLRLPPEEPAVLARAALISRQWCRVVNGSSFRRRFRELHRSTPLLLGYILSLRDSIRFVPLSSRPRGTQRHGVRAVSSNHGRVLLHRLSVEDRISPFILKDPDVHLSVWHPITDEQQDLPGVPLRPNRSRVVRKLPSWDATVICAGGDGCDHLSHLHCHFKVVFVGSHGGRTFSCVYTSQAGGWSDPVFSSEEVENAFVPGNFVLIGTALYNTCTATNVIFKYDLRTDQMCSISITPGPDVPSDLIRHGSMLIATEDGKLGFAKASNSTLGLWLWENGRLEKSRAIDLVLQPYPMVIAFGATGAGVIFLRTKDGYFTIDLKSGSCKKVGEASPGRVVPYVRLCTPAPVADAIPEAKVEDSPDLDDAVMSMPGFTDGELLSAYGHLLDNKAHGYAFVKMNESHRVRWLRTFLAKHYYV